MLPTGLDKGKSRQSRGIQGFIKVSLITVLLAVLPFLFSCAPHLAEVKTDQADIRSGPGPGYPVARMAESGEQLVIVEDLGEWYRVKMPRQGYGWIYKPMVIVLQ
jgi:uncharacterized protein YraI